MIPWCDGGVRPRTDWPGRALSFLGMLLVAAVALSVAAFIVTLAAWNAYFVAVLWLGRG
jgi:hypothetical protein